SLGNGQHVVNENMAKLELMIHDLAGQLERVNRHSRRSRTSRSTMAGTDSSASSRDDDDERSRETRATRTTRHHGDRRTHGHRRHREEHASAKPKITMPTFEGVDPDAWLSRAVQFFEINEVHKSERVQIAAYYMDGEANTWWQWVSHVYKNKGEQIRWRDFEKELIARFGSSEYFDYDEALTRIRQTGSLRDYQKEFKRIASRVRDWPEKALVGAFVGGLKAELAAEVRLDRPRSTRAAMEAARLHEVLGSHVTLCPLLILSSVNLLSLFGVFTKIIVPGVIFLLQKESSTYHFYIENYVEISILAQSVFRFKRRNLSLSFFQFLGYFWLPENFYFSDFRQIKVGRYNRSMIGSLLYLTANRPDICFSVGLCARYQAAPNESHMKAVKHIIKYIGGTTEYGLFYSTDTNLHL
ncbi:Uncharacterized mitochondrial protein AtMg00240, partial [Striga hermonthica]